MAQSDKPAEAFKKSLVLAVLLAGISLPSLTTAQQTEAERAALSERPLTAQEQESRTRDCNLSPPSGTMMFQDQEFSISDFAEFSLLVLIVFDPSFNNDRTGKGVRALPYLPFGGLGYRDNCDPVLVSSFSKELLMALWIRPTLDLEREYPSSIRQIAANDQVLHIDSDRYMVVPSRAKDIFEAISVLESMLPALNGNSAFAQDRFLLWMRGAFFVPLADANTDQ